MPDAKPTPGVLPLTFSDAIERALRHNLAGLLSEYNTIEARGEKWDNSATFCRMSVAMCRRSRRRKASQALGLRSGGPFGKVPPVIGPFSYFDVRVSGTQRVFDWKSIQKYRAAVIGESVAKFNLKDARDLVVLATGNAYFQAIAGAARVETAQAQVDTAKALYDKAVAQQQAGVSPAIDTLRSQVEYQTRQQQLIAAKVTSRSRKFRWRAWSDSHPARHLNSPRRLPTGLFPFPIWRRACSAPIRSAPTTKRRRSDWWPRNWSAARLRPGIFRPSMCTANFGEIGVTPERVLPTYFVAGTY